jgi:phosphate uptake regulator
MNTERMRRQLARAAYAAELQKREKQLRGMTPGHRRTHERGLLCYVCLNENLQRMARLMESLKVPPAPTDGQL